MRTLTRLASFEGALFQGFVPSPLGERARERGAINLGCFHENHGCFYEKGPLFSDQLPSGGRKAPDCDFNKVDNPIRELTPPAQGSFPSGTARPLSLTLSPAAGAREQNRSRATSKPAILVNVVAFLVSISTAAFADEITVLDDDRQSVTIDARWVAEGKGAALLERRDGRWEAVPAERVVQRVPKEMPPAYTPEELEQRLRQEFDEARLVTKVDPPFVLALIAAKPVDKRAARRWDQQLKRAMRFLQGMQKGFLDFAKDADIELVEPKFPLVVLIFEDDREFNRYVEAQTEGQGLSAEKIASFYDLLTNRLALRVRECRTFTTPLHEAIHQQAHNRGVLARLAPVPAWFNEGLATGFEGDGERLKSGPKSLNRRYAAIALNAKATSWTDIVREDKAFQGDILAGEAYSQAWALHWWLYTRYRDAYRKLLRHYSQLTPLTEVSPDGRLKTFEEIVGKSPEELHKDFERDIGKLLKR